MVVRVRFFFLIFFGSSVWAQGLKVTTRSTRARSKTECSMVWYLPTEGGREAVVGGGGDPALHLRGQDLAHRPAAEDRDPVVVAGELGHLVAHHRAVDGAVAVDYDDLALTGLTHVCLSNALSSWQRTVTISP